MRKTIIFKEFCWKKGARTAMVCLKCAEAGLSMGVDFSLTLLHPSPSAQWPDSALGLWCIKHTHVHAHKQTCTLLHLHSVYTDMQQNLYSYKKYISLQWNLYSFCSHAHLHTHTNTHRQTHTLSILYAHTDMYIFSSASKEPEPGNDRVSFYVREKRNERERAHCLSL